MKYHLIDYNDKPFIGPCYSCVYENLCPISGSNNDIDDEECIFSLSDVRVFSHIGNLSFFLDKIKPIIIL